MLGRLRLACELGQAVRTEKLVDVGTTPLDWLGAALERSFQALWKAVRSMFTLIAGTH